MNVATHSRVNLILCTFLYGMDVTWALLPVRSTKLSMTFFTRRPCILACETGWNEKTGVSKTRVSQSRSNLQSVY